MCCFFDPDEFEVKMCLFSLQSLDSQDGSGIFSTIKTASSKRDLQELMSNVAFLASDSLSVNTGLKI